MQNEKVVILTAEDKYLSLVEWQNKNGFSGGAIGKHFSISEDRFQRDINLFGKLVVCEPLMKVLDAVRVEIKRPIALNSFNRTEEYQDKLTEQGYRTAKVSPHVQKLAADIDTANEADTMVVVAAIIKVSKTLSIPVRIGYRDYLHHGQTFVHVDVCPLYYGVDRLRHDEEHPKAWEIHLLEW